MKFKPWFSSVLAVLMATATLQGQSRESLLKYLDESPEWRPSGNSRLYDETNVQTLTGKVTPTLQRYGLTGAAVQEWTGNPGKVRLTLFEMVDASAAYGFFTFERAPEQPGFTTVPLGTEGFRNGSRTSFWQSKYVVKLEGDPKAVDSLGHLVSQNILGRSRKPRVSEHIPPKDLVPNSEKYVIDAAGIDRELGLDAATLGFEDDVEVATAHYRLNGKEATLVLLLYPTQHVARKYADAWDTASPDDKSSRKRVGPLVAWVRGSKDPAVSSELLSGIGYESQVTWNDRGRDLSFKAIIVTIFTFIGIALMFTLVVGLSFGGLRIYMKARYPDRVFDRAEATEIIQLKLDQGLRSKEIGS